jgi:hypothetical protein
VLLLGLLGALAVGEGVTRAFSGRLFSLSNPLYRFDPELGWVYSTGPVQVRTNEEGTQVEIAGDPLGVRAPLAHASPGTSVVLVVGDSFTAGTQVPLAQSWPARVGAALRAERQDVTVVNAGVDGYDLAQEYRMAARLWNRFQPRALVVGLYIGNDIVDYDTEAQAAPPWVETGLLGSIAHGSYLFQFLSGGLAKIEGETTRRRQPPPLPRWNPRVLPGLERLSPPDKDRVRAQFAAVELMPVLRGGAESERRLATTERVLSALSGLATSRGAAFLVALLPTKQQVLSAQRALWTRLMGIDPSAVDLPQQALCAWGAQTGVAVLDLEPVLAADPEPSALYFRVDMHLSEAGHGRVAAAVAPRLLPLLARQVP